MPFLKSTQCRNFNNDTGDLLWVGLNIKRVLISSSWKIDSMLKLNAELDGPFI